MSLSRQILHLHPTSIPFTDWRVIDRLDGAGEVIEFWDTAKLGTQPTPAELAAVTEGEQSAAVEQKRKRRKAQKQAEAAGIDLPMTINDYVRWFNQQAWYASSNFVWPDNPTGTTYWYDITPESRILLAEMEDEAHVIGSAGLIVRAAADSVIEQAIAHTAEQIQTLRRNVRTHSVGIKAQGLGFQMQVLAAADVAAVRALPLPSWASLPEAGA